MIELPASDAMLRIHPPGKDGWSRVELVRDGKTETIGADALDKIVKRLAAGMRDSFTGSMAGMIKGIPVYAVMSLFEEHCTLYAADANGSRLLFVQRPDGSLLGQLTLSSDDRTVWLSRLK